MVKQILFARTELSQKALIENVGGDIVKKIVFYVTDGIRIQKIGQEQYTKAKEKAISRNVLFMPEKIPEHLSVKQDISSIRLVRV